MHRKGFTLVEILLVVIIVGILAAVTIPRIIYNAQTARQEACNSNVSAINSQIELWRMNNGAFPTLAALFADTDFFPEGAPVCPFGTAYALDATTNRVPRHVH